METQSDRYVESMLVLLPFLRIAAGGYRFIIPGIPMRGGKAVGGTFVPTIESARLVRFAMSFREALAMMLTADSSLMSPDFYQWILDLQGPLQKGAFDPTKFALSCINGRECSMLRLSI